MVTMQVTNHAKHSVITCADFVLADGNIGLLHLPELGRMRLPSAQQVREFTHALCNNIPVEVAPVDRRRERTPSDLDQDRESRLHVP